MNTVLFSSTYLIWSDYNIEKSLNHARLPKGHEQLEVEDKLLSLTRQRRTLLSNPGSLTDSFLAESDGYLSILPVPKTEEISDEVIDIKSNYDQMTGPANAAA